MTYKVTSSERTAASASEMETKAMLHLLCEEDDCNIRGFAIDFFNDVTGMDNNAFRLYDIQSKGEDSGPAALGEELVTLFKNYVSEFKDYFVKQVLFVRRVTSSVLNDPELIDFSYADMKDESKVKLRAALIDACKSKTYIADEDITDKNIDAFLEDVRIVIAKAEKADYIKPLIRTSKPLGTTDRDLRAIFSEIRKKQLGIKSSSKVEGVEIGYPYEAYNYGRVINTSDIELLVLSRVINKNPIEAGVPTPFVSIYENYEEDIADDMLNNCQLALARQMFTKREAAAFWNLLGDVVTTIRNMPNAGVDEIYRNLSHETLMACGELDALAHQYFIAIVKEGLGK